MRAASLKSILLGGLLGLISAYTFQFGWYLSCILPLVLAVVYLSIYHTQGIFLALALFTPLSINIEEYTEHFGLFLPTEPLLFGLMLLLLANQLKTGLGKVDYKHPLVITLLLYLAWLCITSITSSHPVVSLKAILSKLWFIVPCFFFVPILLTDWRAIRRFFWLFTLGTVLVILYTVVHHAGFAFGEKESHWVMSPFYKDHTIYGAAVALVLPFPLVLYFSQRQSPLNTAVLMVFFLIILTGLYFSYTRAAWLSVLGALGVLLFVYLRIPFRWVMFAAAIGLFGFIKYGEKIQMELSRNKVEHTTEAFDERLKSAANVTTDASNLERINRWACAIEMFKERPFFGFGLGTYAFEYAPFQEPENQTIISTNFGDMGNAHSEYLSALSETGILGLLFLLSFIGTGFYYLIRLILDSREVNKSVFVFSCGMLFSLSTYFIHAFLNNFLDTDKAAVPVFTMFALTLVLQKFLLAQPKGRI
jgi:O-antigen ligase